MSDVTDADLERAAAALNYDPAEQVSPMDREYVEQIAAALTEEREVVCSRFLGLADAWDHIATVNASASPDSHDDGLGKMAAHAAQAIRRAAGADE